MADAGRVIAGSARGIRLQAPGPATRPLGDRVKADPVRDPRAGPPGRARPGPLRRQRRRRHRGAVSRVRPPPCSWNATPSPSRSSKRTSTAAGLAGPSRATVVRADVAAFMARQREDHPPFDIVLVDPPYADTELRDRVLAWLGKPGAPVAPGARVVVKHFWRDRPPAEVGLLASERERRFGETALTFYRRQEDG